MKPQFSIICPVFNRENLIGDAIKSVINQTISNWELIIVDDGSTDKSKDKIQNFLIDKRIKYYYKINEGQSIARNFGIDQSSGEYICFLDSDDAYHINHLSYLSHLIKSNYKEGVFATGFEIVHKHFVEKFPQFSNDGISVIDYVLLNSLSFNCLCISRNILIENKFDERWRNFEDTHLLVRLLLNYPLIQGSEYTCVLNNHPLRGTYTIYKEKSAFEKIENNVSAIKDLFEKEGMEILRITNKPYLKEFLVSEKYIHHSNGALIYGKPLISLQVMLKAIKADPKFYHLKFYLKYILKFPVFSVYYFLKSKL